MRIKSQGPLLIVLSALVALACTGSTEPSTGVASLTISGGSSQTVVVGHTAQLSAVLRDGAGNVMPNASVTWSTSDSTIASVSTSGLVLGRKSGSATITANAGTVAGSTTMLVLVAPVDAHL
jgi:trimeric autotransporter adhesin